MNWAVAAIGELQTQHLGRLIGQNPDKSCISNGNVADKVWEWMLEGKGNVKRHDCNVGYQKEKHPGFDFVQTIWPL